MQVFGIFDHKNKVGQSRGEKLPDPKRFHLFRAIRSLAGDED